MELQIKFVDVPLDGEVHEVSLPVGFHVMDCAIIPLPAMHAAHAVQHAKVWVAVPKEEKTETFKIRALRTGDTLNDDNLAYVGTVILDGQGYHLFVDEMSAPKATTRVLEEVNLPEGDQ